MSPKSSSTVICSHHWVIDDGLHETSKGLCKRCGAQKTFSNHFKPAADEGTDTAQVAARQTVRKNRRTGLLDQVDSLFDMTNATGAGL